MYVGTQYDVEEGMSKNASNRQFDETWAEEFATAHGLTPRETELLKLLIAGRLETAELALLLDVSPGTIKGKLRTIYLRTGTHSKAELILAVLRHHFGSSQGQ